MFKKHRDDIQFKNLVDAAYDHIVVTDPEGKIIYANPAVTTTTGYSNKEVIGNTPRLWGGLMPASFYKDFWQTIKQDKKPFVGEVTNKRKDGSVYVADVRVTPIIGKHGAVKYFIGIERDITAMKRLDRSRNEFISLVSHQLRTPLSTLNWYSESLLDGDSGKLNVDQKQYVSEIYDATQRMIKLVNDLLNSTRIDFGEIKLQETKIDLYDVFRDILRDCKVAIDKQKLTVKNTIAHQHEYYIYSDQPSLYIVFENIITNAIKYTPTGGQITWTIQEETDGVRSVIQDTGLGISPDNLVHVFERFYRADKAHTRDVSGTGLGLALVKSIVDAYSGSVQVDSAGLQQGTTVTVFLPYHPARPAS